MPGRPGASYADCATDRLHSKGLDQWQPDAPRVWSPEATRVAIEQGTCYLASVGSEAMGTITIDDHADPEFWTVDERQEPALYIHRMVIARAHAGHNLGAALLELANDLAARAGARWLRLDAWKTNTALHDYLQPPRLPAPRTVDLPHRGSGALFQRPVASAQP